MTPETKILTPRDWQATAQSEAVKLLGSQEGAERLAEARRYGALADELERLRAQVERYEYELARARLMAEGSAKILYRIHAVLYPPVHRTDDGRAFRFESPILHEQFQALSDAIRSIPDEVAPPETTATDIEALRAQVAQYKEDAERYRWMKENVKRIPLAWEQFGWDVCIDKARGK